MQALFHHSNRIKLLHLPCVPHGPARSVAGLSCALQLAAALLWVRDAPGGRDFICLDERLRTAALLEGFAVLPGSV